MPAQWGRLTVRMQCYNLASMPSRYLQQLLLLSRRATGILLRCGLWPLNNRQSSAKGVKDIKATHPALPTRHAPAWEPESMAAGSCNETHPYPQSSKKRLPPLPHGLWLSSEPWPHRLSLSLGPELSSESPLYCCLAVCLSMATKNLF